jgi:hypothetical protein
MVMITAAHAVRLPLAHIAGPRVVFIAAGIARPRHVHIRPTATRAGHPQRDAGTQPTRSPLALAWTVGSLPFLGLIVFFVAAWRRTQPGR